jgi:hypothetical protein
MIIASLSDALIVLERLNTWFAISSPAQGMDICPQMFVFCADSVAL